MAALQGVTCFQPAAGTLVLPAVFRRARRCFRLFLIAVQRREKLPDPARPREALSAATDRPEPDSLESEPAPVANGLKVRRAPIAPRTNQLGCRCHRQPLRHVSPPFAHASLAGNRGVYVGVLRYRIGGTWERRGERWWRMRSTWEYSSARTTKRVRSYHRPLPIQNSVAVDKLCQLTLAVDMDILVNRFPP
jgi:hypothetical protein